MNPETFFDKFGLLADTPGGVQKVRELILQLAVQGKLVPQDSNDEPAAVLLGKIKAEKEKLVKEKKIKKAKEIPSIEGDELPYILPKGWEWTRLSEITEIIMGNSPPGNTYNEKGEGVPLINGPVEFSEGPFGHTIKSKFTTKPTKFCGEGDLLICVRGSTTGRTNVAGFKACIGRGVAVIRSKVHQPYINYFILSMRQQIYDLGTGSTFPSISQKHLIRFLVPLPPLNEQRRIVTKVDQLMALCDELEARQQKKQEARLHLNSAALDMLLTAHEPDEFTHHWQRICDNFDLLYGAPDAVGELRKAILQLAVQGKLVRQDSNDEPAAVLLERIQEKKEELVKNGEIKKTKTPFLWEGDEVPYELPKEWKWTKFCDIATIASNLVRPEFYLDLPHVAPNNIEKQTGKLYQYRTIREDRVRSGNHKFYSGQILYSKIRPNLAKVTIVSFEGLCSADMYPINAHIDSEFLLKYMLSQTFLSMSVKKDTRVAMPKINQSELNNILVPVPPISEQHRIVAKVDQLMALCDDLESKLKQSQTDGEKLMEAVVHQLVGAIGAIMYQ